MRKYAIHWLEMAHRRFPVVLKFLARGAISGTVAGFVISLGYSMLFGLPFAFLVVVLILADVLSNEASLGQAVFGSLQAVVFVTTSLLKEFVMPSAIVGLVGGAITGLGIRLTQPIIFQSPLRAMLVSAFFWTPLTIIISNSILPRMLLRGNTDSFQLWVFIIIPSALFVGAMVCVAYKSLFPFLQVAAES